MKLKHHNPITQNGNFSLLFQHWPKCSCWISRKLILSQIHNTKNRCLCVWCWLYSFCKSCQTQLFTCTARVTVLSRISTNMIYSNPVELIMDQNLYCTGFLGMYSFNGWAFKAYSTHCLCKWQKGDTGLVHNSTQMGYYSK